MICAYEECENEFEPKTHNQKYCSDECCRIATNEKLKEAYYEKKARLAGAKRYCKSPGCKSQLDRYNSTNICGKCVSGKKEADRKALVNLVRNVTGKTS